MASKDLCDCKCTKSIKRSKQAHKLIDDRQVQIGEGERVVVQREKSVNWSDGLRGNWFGQRCQGGFNQLDCGVYVDMDRPDSTSMHARQDMWLGFWPDKNDPIQF